MKYSIVSPRLGTPGDPFEPDEGTNVEALLTGGFIRKVSTPKETPAPKVKTSEKEN
jgi:hypothetical protein